MLLRTVYGTVLAVPLLLHIYSLVMRCKDAELEESLMKSTI